MEVRSSELVERDTDAELLDEEIGMFIPTINNLLINIHRRQTNIFSSSKFVSAFWGAASYNSASQKSKFQNF